MERGHDYFKSGHVAQFQYDDKRVDAIVRGTDHYHVEIFFDNETVESMKCDCPYAHDGRHCKHMAAVLHRWSSEIEEGQFDWLTYEEYDESYDCDEEEEEDFDCLSANFGERYVIDEDSVHALLAGVSKADIVSFLAKRSVSNGSLWNHLVVRFRKELNQDDQHAFREEIQAIVSFHSSGYFSNWRDANRYKTDIMTFLAQKVEALIENEQYLHALDLTYYVFTRAARIQRDDPYAVTNEVMDECYRLWKTIWNVCSPSEQEAVNQYFEQQLTGGYGMYVQYHIRDFLLFECKAEAHLLVEMERLDAQIEKWKRGFVCYRKTPMGDIPDILARIYVMELLGADEAQVAAYREKFWWHPSLRKEALDQALHEENYEQAIAIAIDGKDYDIDSPEDMCRHSKALIAIYEKINDKERLKKELLYYLLDYGQKDIMAYYRLKELYEPMEWMKIQKKIIEQQRYIYIYTVCHAGRREQN